MIMIRRFTRRAAGILIGLVLGWYIAGMVIQPGVIMADDTNHAATASSHAEPDHSATGSGDGHGHDPALDAAKLLVPGSSGDIFWYGSVLTVAAGLFIAAVVLGAPTLKMRGPEPPDPAVAHDAH